MRNANLEEILHVLPSSPPDRYLELAPAPSLATRARLNPVELDLPLGSFMVPAPVQPWRASGLGPNPATGSLIADRTPRWTRAACPQRAARPGHVQD